MYIEICQSFNFDMIVETVAVVTYYTAVNTRLAGNTFRMIQNNIEPSMVLKFTDGNGDPIDFSPATVGASSYSLSSVFGFTTTLLNQVNMTTSLLTCTYDPRLDPLCTLAIDQESMKISSVSFNKILNQSYLTVKRNVSPSQHYRNSVIRVIKSHPSVKYLDASNGIIKVYWSKRETEQVGTYDLEVTFDKTSGGVRSKWTVSPLSVEIAQDYSLAP